MEYERFKLTYKTISFITLMAFVAILYIILGSNSSILNNGMYLILIVVIYTFISEHILDFILNKKFKKNKTK